MQPYQSSPLVGVFAVVASAALVLAIAVVGCTNRPPSDLGKLDVEPENTDAAEVDTGEVLITSTDSTDRRDVEPPANNNSNIEEEPPFPVADEPAGSGDDEPADAGDTAASEEDVETMIAELNKPPVGPQIAKSITFDDLELKKMEPDDVFTASHMEDSVRPLIGSKVRIKGVIHPGSTFTTKNIKQFVMVMNSECKFGPGGTAWHSIDVRIDDGPGVKFSTTPITVEGVLTMALFPGRGENGQPATWSVYRLEGIAK